MTSDDRDWLTDDFPELRAAPPWVMEEMIFEQAQLAAPILGADGPEVTRLRDLVVGATAAGRPVVVTGCGTSEHAAMVVVELLNDSFRRAGLKIRAEARQALDAALDPHAGGICIAISHDGGTRATKLALEAARESGATTALITACSDPSCASDADLVFVTPVHDDSWCHTLAYTSAILAGARIAGIAGDEAASAAVGVIESTLERRAAFEAAAAHLGRSGRIVTAGLGLDQVNAGELALKIAEGARISTTAYHLETLLHGHLAGCDAVATSLVLLALDPRSGARRDRRLALVAEAALAIGIPTVALAPKSLLEALPDDVHGVALEPSSVEPLLSSLLQSAVAVQLLTLGLVDLAGTNPDLIRREERAYREAALIGDATPDWYGMRLIVCDDVRRRFPTYRAIVVEASGVRNGPSDDESRGLLREAEARARLRLAGGPPSALPGIAVWRAAMSAFGCKPSRYPCSAEALLKRVARGGELPAINRLVDLYNAISVAYALPLGGEDVEWVRGDVVLMPAVGDEEFDGGDPPAPGEIVWRDDLGVTCRAWNWRQGVRTRITETSTHVYFLLEAIEQEGTLALGRAAEELRVRLDADRVDVTELPDATRGS